MVIINATGVFGGVNVRRVVIPLRKTSGSRWEKKRQWILKRDKYLCQHCKRLGIITIASEVDHIIALCNGGTDDNDNLEAINVECHKVKTAIDKGGVGYDKDGFPASGKHSWNESGDKQ